MLRFGGRIMAVGSLAAVLVLAYALRGAVAGEALLGQGPLSVPTAPDRVVFTLRYLDGQGVWRARSVREPSVRPPTAATVARAFPGFRVQRLTARRFVLTERSAPGEGPFFLRPEGGRVAVAVGRPHSPWALDLGSMPVAPRLLPGRDRVRLSRFPRLDSLAEAWRALEGLAAAAPD
jgi:hypothetical protein